MSGEPRELHRSKDERQQQTQITYEAKSGTQIQAHWWEVSAVAIAPSLHPHLMK